MLLRRALLCLMPALALNLSAAGGDEPARPSQEGPDKAQIGRLIRQLGSNQFSEREAASRQLEKIGPPAMDALRAAESSTADPEVRRRAGEVISIIEDSLE